MNRSAAGIGQTHWPICSLGSLESPAADISVVNKS